MKKIVVVLPAIFLFGNLAFADEAWDTKSAEKKLKGAAKNSFTKKCIADATK
ncbi:MAG: hypothetical protein WAW10_06995 [Gallionella sp.]